MSVYINYYCPKCYSQNKTNTIQIIMTRMVVIVRHCRAPRSSCNNPCSCSSPPTLRPPPSVTTYRPVPDYLSPGDTAEEIADLLADLILDHIDGDNRRDKMSDKVLLQLLQTLTDDISDGELGERKTTQSPLNTLPGPPYLPNNFLPPNSLVTRPPSLQPPQSLFQTEFATASYPPRFSETSLKKFNVEEGSFLNTMIKDLMSELDKKSNNKYSSNRRKLKRRRPFSPRPGSSGGGSQTVDIVVREEKNNRPPPALTSSVNNNRRPPTPVTSIVNNNRRPPTLVTSSVNNNRRPPPPVTSSVNNNRRPPPPASESDNGPFSRYPVRIPQTQVTRSPHFSLPSDSLSGLTNSALGISGRTGADNNLSFEEQLIKMMKELGKIWIESHFIF